MPFAKDNEEGQARRRALWNARKHAMQILANRYPKEYLDLRNQVLARWGQPPVREEFAARESYIMDPKDTEDPRVSD